MVRRNPSRILQRIKSTVRATRVDDWQLCERHGWTEGRRNGSDLPETAAAEDQKGQKKQKRQRGSDPNPPLIARPPAKIHSLIVQVRRNLGGSCNSTEVADVADEALYVPRRRCRTRDLRKRARSPGSERAISWRLGTQPREIVDHSRGAAAKRNDRQHRRARRLSEC